jgi:hypothetical protein
LECCGADDYKDWKSSAFNGNRGSGAPAGTFGVVQSVVTPFRVPQSCCRRGLDAEACRRATYIDPGTSLVDSLTNNLLPRDIYTQVSAKAYDNFGTSRFMKCAASR